MYSPIRRVYLVSIYILGEYISRELFKLSQFRFHLKIVLLAQAFQQNLVFFSKERWRACTGWLVECRRLHKEPGGWRVGVRI